MIKVDKGYKKWRATTGKMLVEQGVTEERLRKFYVANKKGMNDKHNK